MGNYAYVTEQRLFSNAWYAIVLALCAIFPLGHCRGDTLLTPVQKEYLKKLDEPIILRGDYFRAVTAAYKDFAHLLQKREAEVPGAPNKALAERLSKVENFDIHVEQSEGTFIVEFVATVRGGRDPVFGGGARYVIDGTSFAVTDRVYSK